MLLRLVVLTQARRLPLSVQRDFVEIGQYITDQLPAFVIIINELAELIELGSRGRIGCARHPRTISNGNSERVIRHLNSCATEAQQLTGGRSHLRRKRIIPLRSDHRNYFQHPAFFACACEYRSLDCWLSAMGPTRKEAEMTYTIWSNGGKFEWLIREAGEIVSRSGLVFNSRAAAKRHMMKNLPE